MPIFCLQPVDDTSDPRWEATSLKEGCWVRAETENEARAAVELATQRMVDHDPAKGILYSPWQDAKLTTCWPDSPSITVPEGIIVTVSGKTIS
jgi:hypothetical protein